VFQWLVMLQGVDTVTPDVHVHRSVERTVNRRLLDAEVAREGAWRRQVREDHPLMGPIASALTPRPSVWLEPQHITAWRTGGDGEQKVGRRLDAWAAAGEGRVLHDRRAPSRGGNIDHIAVARSGIWVIDAKEYKGRVQQVDVGGWFSRNVRLKVGGRDRSKLATGVRGQMETVAAILDGGPRPETRPPVFGVLCFVGAEWGLFSKPFVFEGIHVAWPLAAIELLRRSGPLTDEQLASAAAVLLDHFPPA
jgi:hypothetical protein